MCVCECGAKGGRETAERFFPSAVGSLVFLHSQHFALLCVCVCVVKSRHPCAQPCEKGSGGNGIGSDDEVSISNGLREEKALRTGSRKEVGMLE